MMDGLQRNDYNERNYFLQPLEPTVTRKISSPYPLYNFKKPEDYHPQGPSQPNTARRPSDPNPSPELTHREEQNQQLRHKDTQPLQADRSDPQAGSGKAEGTDSVHNSRHGSMTDDDKINETGRERRRDMTTSDDEAERGLEILRQLHEQAEAARRLEEEAFDDAMNSGGHAPYYIMADTHRSIHGSVTPTNGYSPSPHLHGYSGETLREQQQQQQQQREEYWNGYYGHPSQHSTNHNQHQQHHHHHIHLRQGQSPSPDSDRDDTPVPGRAPEAEPMTILEPADGEVYYSLSRRRYHPAAPHSEPSYSRDPSPGSSRRRADSQQYFLSSDPEATVGDGYSSRATRTSLLNRAEQLLTSRRHPTRLHSISESPPAVRRKRQGSRKVAFTEDRVLAEEQEKDTRKKAGSPQRSLALLRPRVSRAIVGRDGVDIGKPLRYSNNNKARPEAAKAESRKESIRRMALRRKRSTAGRVLTEYDAYSSGSDDGGTTYSLSAYDDQNRYEMPRMSAALSSTEKAEPEVTQRKARRVWFFKNGDQYFKARLMVISNKMFPNLETLMSHLSHIVPTVSGVKHIFSWPEGKEVRTVGELLNGCYYVCASVNRLDRKVNYGDPSEQYWKNGKYRHNESHFFKQKNGTVVPVSSPSNTKPLVITVISNLVRDSQEKLILNPNTAQNFEDVLGDLHNLVTILHPPVTGLFVADKPYNKVESFASLFREMKEHKDFLVCGEERLPLELKKRDKKSGGTASSDSKGTVRHLKMSQEIARVSSDSMTPRRPAYRRTEPLRCDINGRRREFFAPSLPYLDSDGQKPDRTMRLEWVYGFRGRDVKQNLLVLPNTGELVYFVAAIVVLYDRRTHTQKHYTAHTEEVTCLALHPRYPCIASGQVAGQTPEGAAHVRVWDGLSLSTYAVIGLGMFHQGISCVSFSGTESHSNGDLLLVIDDSDRHVLTVWEWTREDMDQPVARTTTTNDPVVFGCFYPFDEKILVTFGKQHIYFWSIFWNRADGRILRDKKSGIFEDDVPKFVTAVCFAANRDVITGDSTGSILVWSPDHDDIFRIDRGASAGMRYAHKKSVSSLVMLSDSELLSGGGNEIKAWDTRSGYKLIEERVIPEMFGTIRKMVAMTPGPDGQLFIGTAKDVILEGSLQTRFKPVVQGHYEELWAVKAHPQEAAFFTAGHDSTVIKWSALHHCIIWATRDKKPCTSMAVDPHGRLVAVGTTTGRVSLYGAGNQDGRERNSFQVGQAQVNALSFSPTGGNEDPGRKLQLAVGCHDGYVHLYIVLDDGQVYGHRTIKARNNPTFIMHLDWSQDGHFLQTVLGDYEYIVWDVHNLTNLQTGRTVRDVKWDTVSSPVGYPLVGAWNGMERGEVINVACRSKDESCIVVGDSRGRVRLFKYPSTTQRADFRQVKPFSSNTTVAEFLINDMGILTSGGNDAALMQFALE